jgi:acyl-coenzyme A synthetase/AMP-(fatty) acid ligase
MYATGDISKKDVMWSTANIGFALGRGKMSFSEGEGGGE